MTMASCAFSGPATIAGSLVVGNAEVISALALMQLAYPGCPVYYAAAQTAMDLRSGAYTGGGPEDFLFGAATNELSDFYDVPLSMGAYATGAKASDWRGGSRERAVRVHGVGRRVGHAAGRRAAARQPDLVLRADDPGHRDRRDREGDAAWHPDGRWVARARRDRRGRSRRRVPDARRTPARTCAGCGRPEVPGPAAVRPVGRGPGRRSTARRSSAPGRCCATIGRCRWTRRWTPS